MATLRLHLLLGTALIAAAGCAQQPLRAGRISPTARAATAPGASASGAASLQVMQGAVSPTAMPAAAPATPASTAASIAAVKSDVPPSLLLFAHDQGYRQVVMKGDNYYFCKTEDPMGSIIAVRQCLDREQLESLRIRVEQQQEQLSRRSPETTQSAGP
jgi:hypothetical protein